MKKSKIYSILAVVLLAVTACNIDDSSQAANVTLKFTHSWDETPVTNADFNDIKFTNKNGETLSIERLRYLISRVMLTDEDNFSTTFEGYNLVDVTNNKNLEFKLKSKVATGTYKLSFVFGFNNDDNTDGAYADLNSATWNVPMMLGGGYHYMQLDGKYNDENSNPQNYNYHAIRAVNRANPDNLVFQNTFFTVDLGSVTISEDQTIKINMNIAEWFKNPNTWNLNELNTRLMPNFDAQVLMYQNGQNVFSLAK